jgi:WD40 repeat protein/serine/threonine protein kinase
MTEREIFLDALDKEGAERASYLDAACSDCPALRLRVEDLLRSHREADTFLTVPAMEQIEAVEESLAFLDRPRDPSALGQLDHYEVLDVIGRGATGVVLRARDTKLLRIVAIKVLGQQLAASAGARQRFIREAQAAAAVRDDHVVAIHAVCDDGPRPYLVMEYIRGKTLEEKIKQTGAMVLAEILRIGSQLARGLAAAHAQGVIHRDIKPANILLENGIQRVKITDFGLARALDDVAPTKKGVLAGTPLFMSPEQARGEATDHRTDLFSLGSVLYMMCAGRPPFLADSMAEVLKRVGEDTPPSLRELNPDIPAWLDDLIAKLHAKKVGDRWASAHEVADALGEQLARLQQSLPPLTKIAARGRRHLVALGLAGLLVTLAALVLWMRPWEHSPEPDPDPGPSVKDSHPIPPLEFRREDIPPHLLALAGGGDPARAPAELVAVLGDGRFLLPRVETTSWMDQSPDSKVLAVPLDGDVVLFDAATGEHLRSLKGPPGRVNWVTFSPDGQLLLATSGPLSSGPVSLGGKASLWDVSTGRELFTQGPNGLWLSGIAAFSRDSQYLVGVSGVKLRVWQARSGQEVQTVEPPTGVVPALYFSPDGRRLAVALSTVSGVKLFDWDGEKLTALQTLPSRQTVGAVAYSPDGKFLASGDSTGFTLWNAATLAMIRTVATPATQLAFAPDSQVLFAGRTNGQPKSVHTMTRWDVATGQELPPLAVESLTSPLHAFPYLGRDGKVLFVTPWENATYVRAIDTATGKELYPRKGHTAPLYALAISPDGRTLASGGEDRVVKLWDLAGRRVLHDLAAHTVAVCGLAFSPDGRLLASASRDGTIILWDVKSGALVRTLHDVADGLFRIQFSPDGRVLAAGGHGGIVRRWVVADGKEFDPLPGHTGFVRCVAFSPDGAWLASGAEDKTVRLHDLTYAGVRTFKAPGGVTDLAFSPDSRTVAAVSDAPNSAVLLWDAQTGSETSLSGHGGYYSLAFAPSGSLLATRGTDGTVRLWDRSKSKPHVRAIGPGVFDRGARAIAFTTDGRYLVAASFNGMIHVLRIGAGEKADQ